MLTTLNEWSTGLGELQAKMAGASAAQKAQIAAALTKLRQQQKDYQAQMAKVRAAGEDAFGDLRRGAERMVRKITRHMSRLRATSRAELTSWTDPPSHCPSRSAPLHGQHCRRTRP